MEKKILRISEVPSEIRLASLVNQIFLQEMRDNQESQPQNSAKNIEQPAQIRLVKDGAFSQQSNKIEDVVSPNNQKQQNSGSRLSTSNHNQNVEEGLPRIQPSPLSRYNELIDKLSKPVKVISSEQEIQQAMKEAKGFNLVSKSMKYLPKLAQDGVPQRLQQEVGFSKNSIKFKKKTQIRLLKQISQSNGHTVDEFSQIVQREEKRDQKLSDRLKSLSQRQAVRIQEIQEKERGLADLDYENFTQMHRKQSVDPLIINQKQKQLFNQPSESQKVVEKMNSTSNIDLDPKNNEFDQKDKESAIDQEGHMNYQQFFSSSKGTKTHIQSIESQKRYHDNHTLQSTALKRPNFLAKKQGQQNLKSHSVLPTCSNRSIVDQNAAQNQANKSILSSQKRRDNLSYLNHPPLQGACDRENRNKHHQQQQYAINFKNNMLHKICSQKNQQFDHNNQAAQQPGNQIPTTNTMISQSLITTGDASTDDYLQVALAMRKIGTSIVQMPESIDDLRLLSQRHFRNLDVNQRIKDEIVYLEYIEEHQKAAKRFLNNIQKDLLLDQESNEENFKNQEQNIDNDTLDAQKQSTKVNKVRYVEEAIQTKSGDNSRGGSRVESPVRQLADFYNQKMGRIVKKSITMGEELPESKNKFDIDAMTPNDLTNLEKNPPKINPCRKRMSLVNHRVSSKFGENVFIKGSLNQKRAGQDQSVSPKRSKSPKNVDQQTKISHNRSTGGSPRQEKLEIKTLKHNLLTTRADQNFEGIQAITGLMTGNRDLGRAVFKELNSLGKPSSRQDAILLAEWFQNVTQKIAEEHKRHKQVANFLHSKTFQNTIDQSLKLASQRTDTFILTQIIHNLAIKEISRQVSVQCVERGLLLKTIFDSYVKLIDLVFLDGFDQRAQLAKQFALAMEDQIEIHQKSMEKKEQIMELKDRKIQELQLQNEALLRRERGLQATNKRLAKMSFKDKQESESLNRDRLNLSKKCKFLETRIESLLSSNYQPQEIDSIKKEMDYGMRKIQQQSQLDFEHAQLRKRKDKSNRAGNSDIGKDLELIAGEILGVADKQTDMDDMLEWRERCNGGPLNFTIASQTIKQTEDRGVDGFDLIEVGAAHNKFTEIDPSWRRDTKPTRMRPKSARQEYLQKHRRIPSRDSYQVAESVGDSSEHTVLDYADVNAELSKSWTFGFQRRFDRIRRRERRKRTLSLGNFNWNALYRNQKIPKNVDKNQRSIIKLQSILGAKTLEEIKQKQYDFYLTLMEFANLNKVISSQFCKQVLQKHKVQIEQEKQIAIMEAKNRIIVAEIKAKVQQSTQGLNSPQQQHHQSGLKNSKLTTLSEEQEHSIELLKISQDLKVSLGKVGQTRVKSGAGQDGLRSGHKNAKGTTKEGYKSNSRERKDDSPKKEHQSLVISNRLVDKFNSGKDLKEQMPYKALLKTIYHIYAEKIVQMPGVGQENAKKMNSNRKDLRSQSPQMKIHNSFAKEKKDSTLKNLMSKRRDTEEEKDSNSQASYFMLDAKLANSNSRESLRENDFETKKRSVKAISFKEWVFDNFQNKFGFKSVSDKKFVQLVSTTLKNMHRSPRVRLFARFMNLNKDPLDDSDLRQYFQMLQNMFKTVLNFNVTESDELVYIPINRAIEYFRQTFQTKLTQNSLQNCLKIIRQKIVNVTTPMTQKMPHLIGFSEAVIFDDFAEFVIHTTKQLHTEKMQNISDIFAAADLSDTGYLDLNELRILYKILAKQGLENNEGDESQTNHKAQDLQAKKLFDRYSSQIWVPDQFNSHGQLIDQGFQIYGLNLKNFRKLCLEQDIFSIQQQNSFLNEAQQTFLSVTDDQDAFVADYERVVENIDTIYERLNSALQDVPTSDIVSDADLARYKEMIELMVLAILKPTNKKIAFLTFKIVEETIKKVYLKTQIEKYVPLGKDLLTQLSDQINLAREISSQSPNRHILPKFTQNSNYIMESNLEKQEMIGGNSVQKFGKIDTNDSIDDGQQKMTTDLNRDLMYSKNKYLLASEMKPNIDQMILAEDIKVKQESQNDKKLD